MTGNKQDKRAVLLRRFLCDEVTRIIKERIFSLEYPRGSRLLVESLSQDLQVSMTPVREGLKSLVAEGLVVYDGKSYSVFNPTMKEIADIFCIRRSLEKLSASLAAEHMAEEDIDALLEMYGENNVHEYINNQSDLIRIDKIFHAKVLVGADNDRLETMLASVEEQCWLIRAWGYSNAFPPWYAEKTIEEHIGILNCMKKRNPMDAGNAMEQHILNGEQRTLESLKNSQLIFPIV